MSSKKFFYVLTAILALLILALFGAAVGGNMLLEKQSKKLSSLKLENETTEMQQNALIQARADAQKYSELNEITRSSLHCMPSIRCSFEFF